MHFHKYDLINAQPGISITTLLYRCRWCDKAKSELIDGAWTLEQLRPLPPAPLKPLHEPKPEYSKW